MNKFSKVAYLTAVWLLALTASAMAEETKSEQVATVSPRFGIQYTTEGAGFESLGSVDLLIPLFQNPGNNVTFVQGRLFLDSDSKMGGHGLVGHRVYDQKNDRIVGVYVGYDARDTGENYFKQLGIGFETLGKWDFRTNAYIPLGDSRQQVGSAIPVFTGNSVFAQRVLELGLHGVDAEIGTKIANLGSGDVRGYAGAYYFSAAGKEAFGWKARVEARPTSFVGVNLSLQNDALFDTRAVLSVGVSFPGSGTTKGKQQGENWSRMGNFLERRTAIATTTKVSRTALINPETNQPWNIIYVADNGNSNGTKESPYGFGDFQKAVGDAQRNPGSLIYIRSNSPDSTLPRFTIPTDTEVASTIGRIGIETTDRELSVVPLPFVGQGVQPTIAGGVTLGNNTSLVGFTINGRVRGENVSNVNIINNQIQKAEGIDLFNATGEVNILGNTLNGAGSNSIIINNDSGTADIAIAGNSLENSTAGIQISASGSAEVNAGILGNAVNNALQVGIGVEFNDASKGSVLILGNTVSNVQLDELSDGIYVGAYNTAALSSVDILFNTATNTSGRGISVGSYPDSNHNSINTDVSIIGNSVDQAGVEGIVVEGISGTTNIIGNEVTKGADVGVSVSNTNGNVSIVNNLISDNQGSAINIAKESGDANIIAIADNLLKNNLNGVELDLTGNATAKKVLISGNEITGKGFAVNVNVANNSLLDDLKIQENTITGSLEDISQGIQVGTFNSAQVNTEISNNQIENVTLAGIGVELNQNSKGSVNIANNTISNVQADELSDGIYVDLLENAKTSDINISDNTITKTTGRGVSVGNYTGNSGITLAITGNTVEQTDIEGIAIEGVNGTTNINNNTVKNTSGDGVSLVNTTGSVNLNSNTISDNQENGITVSNESGDTEIAIANNQISNNSSGVLIELTGDATANAQVTGNTIKDTSFAGVGIELNDNSQGRINIANNTIQNVRFDDFSDGIYIELFDNSSTGGISILGNTIMNTTGRGISVGNYAGNTGTNVEITGNSIDTTDAQGIGVEGVNGRTTIRNNTINNAVGEGIYVGGQTGPEDISGNTITNTRP